MAKNEAKILFTAETGEFNDSIKKANSEMSKLRAEAKLNEAQMKTSGTSIEGLENKYQNLQDQLKASESKTEALNQKINSATKYFGENSEEVTKLKTQLANAQTAEEKIKQAIQACTDEIEDHKRSMDDAGDSAKTMSNDMGDLDKNLDNAGDSAGSAGDGFTVLKGVVADLASSAIQMAIGKISEFIGYLADLPAQTMELRQDLATLTTSFDDMGFSTETAKDTWKELYAIFGEDDRAVEASNLIAKMADDQADLDAWTTITTGAWAKFQDSLPVEGLAETAMETAKTGKLTGTLTDALVWCGVSEEAFQEQLDACNSEQERQQLITDTLIDLFGESAETYRDTAGAQMEAKEATAENMLAETELASAIEPVTTAFTELKTSLLEAFAPAIETVSGLMTDALEWANEHPVAMKAIASAVGILAVGLAGLATAVGVYTVAQWAMNSALLANPITWIVMAIIAVIALLVAAIVVVIEYWDEIVKATTDCWNKIKQTVTNVVNNVKNTVSNIFNAIKTAVSNVWNGIKTTTSNVWNGIKTAVSNVVNGIKSVVSSVFNAVKSTASSVWNSIKTAISNPINSARDAVKSAIDKIKSFFNFSWSLPKLKLPHVSIKGKFSISPPSVPKFSISWYKEGGILTAPTIFGINGNTLMAGGEAGPEAILPIDKLEGYIANVVEKTTNVVNLQSLANSIEALASRPIELSINDRQIALATASATDGVNGLRSSFRNRGLVLD